jgi:hypothetical protein
VSTLQARLNAISTSYREVPFNADPIDDRRVDIRREQEMLIARIIRANLRGPFCRWKKLASFWPLISHDAIALFSSPRLVSRRQKPRKPRLKRRD